MLQPKKPKFDPNKPFEEVKGQKPKFDPNQPFSEVKKKEKTESDAISQKENTASEIQNGSLASTQSKKPNPNTIERNEVLKDNTSTNASIKLPTSKSPKKDVFTDDEFSNLLDETKQEQIDIAEQRKQNLLEQQKQFKSHVAHTEDDELEVQDRFKSEKTVSGFEKFVDGAMTIGKRLMGVPKSDAKTTTIPFEKEIKEVKQQALREKTKLSDKDLQQQAEERFIQKQKDFIYVDKANDYLENLDPKTKGELANITSKTVENLSDENKKIAKVNTALNVVINEDLLRLKTLQDSIPAIPRLTTQEESDAYNSKVQEYQELRQNLIENTKIFSRNQDALINNQEDLQTAEQEYDLLKRSYGLTFLNNMAITTSDLVLGGVDFLNYLNNTANELNPFQEQYDKMYKAIGIDTSEVISTKNARDENKNERENVLRKPVESVESVNGFMNYMSDLVANQLPILAVTSAGYGGLATLGATSTGQKYAEMNDEVLEGKATYKPWQMMSVPLGHGTAEAVFELPTLAILKNGKRVLNAAVKGSPGLIRKSALDQAKGMGSVFMREIGSEQATNLFQNAFNIYGLGKEGSITDNAMDVLKDSAALTLLLQGAPHIASKALQPFQTKDNVKVLEENAAEMLSLTKKLENSELTETEVSVIEGKINELNKTSSDIMAKTIGDVSKMPEELHQEIVKINEEAGQLRAQAQDIYLNGKSKDKKELLKIVEDKHKALQEKRIELLNTELKPKEDVKSETPTKEAEKPKVEIATPNTEAKQEVVEPTETKLNQVDNTNETKTEGTTAPNAEIKPRVESSEQQGESDTVQPTVEPAASESQVEVDAETEIKNDINHAVKEVEKGVLSWDGNPFSPRVDLGLSRADVRKGEADIKRGKYDSVPAKRVIQALKDVKKQGYYDYMEGTGGKVGKIQVPLTEILDSETELDVKELDEINKNEDQLSNEYDTWFNSLDENAQNEILDDYEGSQNESRATSTDSKIGKSETNISDKKETSKPTKAERKQIAKAKVDEIADAISGMDSIFGIKIKLDNVEGLNKNGVDIVSMIASIAKQAIDAGIEIDVAIQKTIAHLKTKFDFEVDVNEIKNKLIKNNRSSGISELFKRDSKLSEIGNEKQYSDYLDSIFKDSKIKDIVYHNSDTRNTTENFNQTSDGIFFTIDDKYYGGRKNKTFAIVNSKNPAKAGVSITEWNDAKIKQYKEAGFDSATARQVKDPMGNITEMVVGLDSFKIEKPNATDAEIQKNTEIYNSEEVVKDNYEIAVFDTDQIHVLGSNNDIEGFKNFVNKKPITKAPKTDKKVKGSQFEKLANDMPNTSEVKEYLSGETTEKYTGEKPENDQNYLTIKLKEALFHGVDIIESAKDLFGSDYVSKTLAYLDDSALPPAQKALIYVSLANELNKDKLLYPDNKLTIQKQLNLVNEKRQAFARSNSIALNMSRLQQFSEVGYNPEEVTDSLFSPKELAVKRGIEKAMQSNMDDINAEAERQEQYIEDDFEVDIPKRKRNNTVLKRELSDVWKNMKLDIKKASNDGTLSASIPYAKQLIAATPHILKATKILAEMGFNKGSDIVNEIYRNIKEAFPGLSKKDIAKVIKDNQPKKGTKKPKKKTNLDVLKGELIESGYSRVITVYKKVELANGRTEKVKEKRTILDWKKLAGEEGSIDNMKRIVSENLEGKDYSDQQVKDFIEQLEDEFHDLRANIIEKSINELEYRNRPKGIVDRKTDTRRLAELYNYGLYEEGTDAYDNIMNSLMGLNGFDQKTFNALKEKSQKLSELYRSDYEEKSVRNQINQVQKQINDILYQYSFKNGGLGFKAASLFKEFSDLSTRLILHSVGQIVQNPFSGMVQRGILKASNIGSNTGNKELSANRSKVAWAVFRDIATNKGDIYGDTQSDFTGRNRTEGRLNKVSDNKVYQTVLTGFLGRMHLEAPDSFNKVIITKKKFEQNLIKVLTSDSNPNGAMSKKDAVRYVTEALTGQSFEDAMVKAQKLIDKINAGDDKKTLADNKSAVIRLADSIVREALVSGGKLTQQEVEASYNAAYKSAGFDIGHEANNFITKSIQLYGTKLDRDLKKAVKDKNYALASLLTFTTAVYRNMLTTFVGGGTNWVVITAQNMGVDIVSPIYDNIKAKSNKIDLATEDGVKNLENALLRKANARSTNARLLIGGVTQIALAYAAVASGAADDMEDYLDKNKWAKKYFSYIAPSALAIWMASDNKDREFVQEIEKIFGIRGQYFSDTFKFSQSVDKLYQGYKSGNQTKIDKGYGNIGQLLGGKINAPIPWRTVRDFQNIYRGLEGLKPIKPDYKADDFWDGALNGGFIEFIELQKSKKSGSDW